MTDMTCASCKSTLDSLGQIPMRVGGTKGAWHLVFGELADLTEGTILLDVYRCPSCTRLEFYDHDESIPIRD